MLLPYTAIAEDSIMTPKVIQVCAGPGGDGKSILRRDLMGAVRGHFHVVSPPSLLQDPEEFRKQRPLYRGLKWVSVDEWRPTRGVEDGVFKIFASGGSRCLRRRCEPETHFADFPRCGEKWVLNPDDVPHVQISSDAAFRRRLRCVRMRARFSANEADVGPKSPIFHAGDALREWIRIGEAASVFLATILIPRLRKSSRCECEAEISRHDVQISGDTDWLVL